MKWTILLFVSLLSTPALSGNFFSCSSQKNHQKWQDFYISNEFTQLFLKKILNDIDDNNEKLKRINVYQNKINRRRAEISKYSGSISKRLNMIETKENTSHKVISHHLSSALQEMTYIINCFEAIFRYFEAIDREFTQSDLSIFCDEISELREKNAFMKNELGKLNYAVLTECFDNSEFQACLRQAFILLESLQRS